MAKKWLKILALPLIILIMFIVSISLKVANPFKPTFLNYAQYTSPKQIEKINKNYTYKEYKGIDQFSYFLENDKAVGGIGADYAIVNLIKKNKIQKIDFKKNFNIDNPMSYYTEAVQKQLKYFDQFLLGIDNDKDGLDDKFYEYIIPYFINTKVLALNIKKTNLESKKLIQNKSYLEALKFLSQNKVSTYGWVDTKIENATIGYNKTNKKITIDNYKMLVDNFAQTINEGTKYLINDARHNIFEEDSDVLLQNVIDPNNAIQVASIYNGDALDAYYSQDNFELVPDGSAIRAIKLKNAISILDCFVVSNSLSKESANELIQFLNPIIFSGTYIKDKKIIEQKISDEKGNVDYTKLAIAWNFDWVNYTPVSKGIYDYILENYFDNDKIAAYIYQVKIDEINPIAPVDDETKSSLNIYFKSILSL